MGKEAYKALNGWLRLLQLLEEARRRREGSRGEEDEMEGRSEGVKRRGRALKRRGKAGLVLGCLQ